MGLLRQLAPIAGALFLSGSIAQADPPVLTVLSGEIPPVELKLDRGLAGETVDIIAVRGHSNPALAPNQAWISRFRFTADANGKVRFASRPPEGNWLAFRDARGRAATFGETDPWAPFWTMTTAPKAGLPAALRANSTAQARLAALAYENVLVAAMKGGALLALQEIRIVRTHPDVQTAAIDAATEQFVGTFHFPKRCGRGGAACPGLVLWGGSNGPVSPEVVDFYANRGVAVLAIEYFTGDAGAALPYLTMMINRTPLEIVERAILWLRKQPQVDAAKVAISGVSRGGELALIAGAKFSHLLAGVIANRPHYVSVSSSVNGNAPIALETQAETFAWTYRGEGIPYAPISRPGLPRQGINELAEATGGVTRAPDGTPVIRYLPAFQDADARLTARGQAAVDAARIPVGLIAAPLMVIAMEDDQMWPSPKALSEIRRVRAQDRRAHPEREGDVYLLAAMAGHYTALPGSPTAESMQATIPGSYLDAVDASGRVTLGKSIWVFGGDPLANHRCNVDVYGGVLRFLSGIYGQSLQPMALAP